MLKLKVTRRLAAETFRWAISSSGSYALRNERVEGSLVGFHFDSTLDRAVANDCSLFT